jgi:hypothetical protein
MEQISRSLPLRLIPTKGSQVWVIIFSLAFIGFAGFMISKFNPFALVEKNGPIGYFLILFFAIFFLIPIAGLASAVFKLLPGSPYYYLQIASDGLLLRQGWKSKRFAWSELSPFAVHVEVQTDRDKHGNESTTTYYYVVAVPSADEALLQDRWKRYSHSVFSILADEYGAGGEEEDADSLANWLTEIRGSALANSGRAATEVTVPPEFRGTVVAPSAWAPIAAPAAQSRVIER